ncbi:MAG TPA: DUF4190 domain-containing protein [Actinomycetota bacterium]|nr:DUF4190 domain-containing protein [Actinomycetota bacterium]
MTEPPQPAPPPPAPVYQVPYGKTNGFAIASLVLGIVGILGLWLIGPILALVFGYMGKGQIDRSGGVEQGRGMAIAGIVLGWVGIVWSIAMAAWMIWFFTSVFPNLPFDRFNTDVNVFGPGGG